MSEQGFQGELTRNIEGGETQGVLQQIQGVLGQTRKERNELRGIEREGIWSKLF